MSEKDDSAFDKVEKFGVPRRAISMPMDPRHRGHYARQVLMIFLLCVGFIMDCSVELHSLRLINDAVSNFDG